MCLEVCGVACNSPHCHHHFFFCNGKYIAAYLQQKGVSCRELCNMLRIKMCLSCVLQVPIPEHMDLYHLHQEAEPSDRTALESVVVCPPTAVTVLLRGPVAQLLLRLVGGVAVQLCKSHRLVTWGGMLYAPCRAFLLGMNDM